MDSNSPPAPGVSGKKFTVAMVSTMIIVGGLLAYELAIYENLDRARAKSAEHWRVIATQLDKDYKLIEALNNTNEPLDPAWQKEFRHGADQFRTATNNEEQLRLARSLEQLLQSNPAAKSVVPKMSDELKQEISDLNASLTTERNIQQSLSGKIVQFFIRHPIRELWEDFR